MKLLVLTTRLFRSPGSGGEICTARLLQGLAKAGHELVLVGRGDARAASHWARQVVSIGEIEPPFDEQGAVRRVCAVLGALPAGLPVTAHRQGGHAAAARVAPYAAWADAIVVDHLQVWPWLGKTGQRPVMLVQHNVESDNYLRRSRAANRGYQGNPRRRWLTRLVMRREAMRLLALELRALEDAAVVACLSEADSQRMADLAQRAGRAARAELVTLPGFPLTHAMTESRTAVPTGELPAIGLIGTWTWAPNREALMWMLTHVWPRLQGRARLVLAGNGLDGLPLPAGTQLLGRVAEVGEFFGAVDLVAVPSLTGSGVQEKAIEALASGLPVVATPHALRGLGDALPPRVYRAHDPAAFAEACLRALASGEDSVATADHAEAVAQWAATRRRDYALALGRCLRALGSGSDDGTEALRPRPVPLPACE